jgi:predicted deacetylase
MKLLVSIHDVTPAHDTAIRALWTMCEDRSLTPALLVVPNWHGTWPLPGYPSFTRWIRDRAAQGAEIFLHGERHDEEGSTRTFGDALRAFGRTECEGEFLSLTESEAEVRIARGLRTLQACGLVATGFVPPAWLGRRGWWRAVAASGLRISEDDASIHLHDRAMSIPSPVTRWSARTRFRANVSSWLADARWRRDSRAPLVRVALHPRDLDSAEVRTSIQRTLDRWLVAHHPWRYAEL